MPILGADSDDDEMPPLESDGSEDENEVRHKAARTSSLRRNQPPVRYSAAGSTTSPAPEPASCSGLRGRVENQPCAKNDVRPKPKTAAGGPPRRTTPASGKGDSGGSVEQQDLGDPLTYLVSLCDGLGAAMVAVSQKTSRLQGFLCEKKEHLREFTAKKWPQFDSCARIEQVDVEDLAKRIAAVDPDIVLLVAGTPCQPLSGLATDPKGFEDERTAPILHFVRIRDGLDKILAGTGPNSSGCSRRSLRCRSRTESSCQQCSDALQSCFTQPTSATSTGPGCTGASIWKP